MFTTTSPELRYWYEGYEDALQIPCEDQENNPPPGAALRVVQSGPVPVLRALQPCCESRGIKVGRGYASDEDEVEGGKLIPSETILAQVCIIGI